MSAIIPEFQTYRFYESKVLNNNVTNSNSSSEIKTSISSKRDSKNINEDELTTDWTPEIPFKNVI